MVSSPQTLIMAVQVANQQFFAVSMACAADLFFLSLLLLLVLLLLLLFLC